VVPEKIFYCYPNRGKLCQLLSSTGIAQENGAWSIAFSLVPLFLSLHLEIGEAEFSALMTKLSCPENRSRGVHRTCKAAYRRIRMPMYVPGEDRASRGDLHHFVMLPPWDCESFETSYGGGVMDSLRIITHHWDGE
jgi:hypothetical protein